jgi:anti-anti-sigma regulatory factor
VTAAVSILSEDPDRTVAEVIGAVGRENAAWVSGHLRTLEGDVTLDCTHLTLRDRDGASALADFVRFLRDRGRRLVLRGISRSSRRLIDALASPVRSRG